MAKETGSELNYRERMVADGVGEGMDNRSIAADLDLAEMTIRNLVHSAYDKLGFRGKGAREKLGAWARINRYKYVHGTAKIEETLREDLTWHSYVYRESTILDRDGVSNFDHYNRQGLENGCLFRNYTFRALVRGVPPDSWSAVTIANPSDAIASEYKITFAFNRPLPRERTLIYEYWQTFSGMPVTLADAERSTEFNLYARGRVAVRKNWRIVRPTERLVRVVNLPLTYKITEPRLWVYADQMPVHSEMERIASRLSRSESRDGQHLELTIEEPKMNLLYSLEWRPVE